MEGEMAAVDGRLCIKTELVHGKVGARNIK